MTIVSNPKEEAVLHGITIAVDKQTYDLIRNWGESEGVAVAVKARRLVDAQIARQYTRDADGQYHTIDLNGARMGGA